MLHSTLGFSDHPIMRPAVFRSRFPAPAKTPKAPSLNVAQTVGALRRMSSAAIVAAAALPLLAACGQRGPLYLPTVPPLPAPPQDSAYSTPNNAARDGSDEPGSSASGTSGASGTVAQPTGAR
ncbi:putative small lipoprotein YifL [Robbsia andropogonis]